MSVFWKISIWILSDNIKIYWGEKNEGMNTSLLCIRTHSGYWNCCGSKEETWKQPKVKNSPGRSLLDKTSDEYDSSIIGPSVSIEDFLRQFSKIYECNVRSVPHHEGWIHPKEITILLSWRRNTFHHNWLYISNLIYSTIDRNISIRSRRGTNICLVSEWMTSGA